MGTQVGRSTLFGIPLQQTVVLRELGRLRADLLPADATRRSTTTRSPTPSSRWRTGRCTPEQQARLRSDDHRLQPGRHVRRRSHPPGAADLSRRLLRHRRVHHPQGVRLRRRSRATSASLTDPGARPASSTSPARSGLVVLIHNDIDMPFAKAGAGARTSWPQMRALLRAAPEDDDHLGAHRARPGRAPGRATSSALHRTRLLERSRSSRHVYFDISWDEVGQVHRRRRPRRSQRTAALINRYPDRFLFGTDDGGAGEPTQYHGGVRHVRAALEAR